MMAFNFLNDTRIDISDAHLSLADFLKERLNCEHLRIEESQRLSGGAIQENWLLKALVTERAQTIRREWVLRTDSASSVAVSMSRDQEFAVLSAVHQAGVKVPAPLWLCRDTTVIGRDFFIMEALRGTTSGYRLTTDKTLDGARCVLSEELGRSLALLHQITPAHPGLSFLPAPHSDPTQATINLYRQYLDALPGSHPVIEWGLRWCELNRPDPMPARLIHRDYRTGNFMVDQGRLTGVLDWEFACWGDPREDLGWFTAKCWRFARQDREAGGIGELHDFLRGYQEVCAASLVNQDLTFWQLLAHVRWAVVALQQAQRHLSRQQRSLELALTGRMVPELEYEILALSGARS
jgi:aminoglycoside phosphotransferase (APT) family kinase protein